MNIRRRLRGKPRRCLLLPWCNWAGGDRIVVIVVAVDVAGIEVIVGVQVAVVVVVVGIGAVEVAVVVGVVAVIVIKRKGSNSIRRQNLPQEKGTAEKIRSLSTVRVIKS